MRLAAMVFVGLAFLTSCTTTSSESTDPATAAPYTPSGSPSGATEEPVTDLQLIMKDEYVDGDIASVRLSNASGQAYEYRSTYAACELIYKDESGREFIIPPGTHCDLLSEETVHPGETVNLFKWKLNECTKDQWGCTESEPLLPGTYTVSGQFKPVANGQKISVSTSFELLAT